MEMQEINGKEYPASPKANQAFKRHWDNLIQDVYERDNFKASHLHTLKILVDLYMDYDLCRDKVNLEGYTYESEGRNGFQIKRRPEVDQLNTIVKDIASFSKLLGITLMKDTMTKTPKNEESEWS